MSECDEDIPPGVDFLSEGAALKWAQETEEKLQSRIEFFAAFEKALAAHAPRPHDVLELGSGPGFLAEYLLSQCSFVERYTLLDFSPTMMDMARKRLQRFTGRMSFLQIDFKQPDWASKVDGAYDCIVSIQAVHELRHKKYAAEFYSQCRALLKRDGLMLVCDRLPQDDSQRNRALFMTEDEQLTALREGGFAKTEVLLRTTERIACRAVN